MTVSPVFVTRGFVVSFQPSEPSASLTVLLELSMMAPMISAYSLWNIEMARASSLESFSNGVGTMRVTTRSSTQFRLAFRSMRV